MPTPEVQTTGRKETGPLGSKVWLGGSDWQCPECLNPTSRIPNPQDRMVLGALIYREFFQASGNMKAARKSGLVNWLTLSVCIQHICDNVILHSHVSVTHDIQCILQGIFCILQCIQCNNGTTYFINTLHTMYTMYITMCTM